jgi:hypothetical protein
MHLPRLTSLWWRWIEEEESGGCSRATAAEDEAGSSGVDSSGGDLQSRERVAGT